MEEGVGRSFQGDATVFHDVAAVGDLEGHVGVLCLIHYPVFGTIAVILCISSDTSFVAAVHTIDQSIEKYA